MRKLAVILIFLKLICELNCSQPTHVDHVCSGRTSVEQAGVGSGTLTFRKRCEITITDIPEFRIDQVSRLNVVGVAMNESCVTSKIIVIDEAIYCIDASVNDTVITVKQRVKFGVLSDPPKTFTLQYYRGEP